MPFLPPPPVPFLPSAVTGECPPLAADPSLLLAAQPLLLQVGDALGAALPGLGSAWSAAAGVLAGQRAGQALAACQGATLAALGQCRESLEDFARAMGAAGVLYREADIQAVPGAGVSGTSR